MPHIAILYGFAEGPAHAHRLNQCLRQEGFTVVKNISEADVILTHSGGILELPAIPLRAKVFCITPSTGYAYSLRSAAKHKVRLDILHAIRTKSMGFWLKKTALNIWYGMNVLRGIRLYRAAKECGRDLPGINARRVMVVVQPSDPWSGNIPEGTIKKRPYSFVSVNGYHDDLWRIPKTYTDILKHL